MSPYYDVDGITIYHGDCLDVLPGLDHADVGLVLTDPPYGIDLKWGGVSQTSVHPQKVVGDAQPFNPESLLTFGRCILFGANHYAHRLPSASGWLVWDKVTRNGVSVVLGDAELAWTNCVSHVRVFRHMWTGAFRDSERGFSVHPTQKPVELMRWIVGRWSNPGDLILDPYMGSGPVAQACRDLGRRYVGVEVEEKYCEIAVQRLAQGVLEFE